MHKNYIGVDIGSRTAKLVCLDHQKKIIYNSLSDTGLHPGKTAAGMYKEALEKLALKAGEIGRTYATGYGRYLADFADGTITEITCHARGVNYLFPESRTVLDIGGQDSKSILMNSQGQVTDFVMNDKCAAGTGRFLEVVSIRLGLDLDDLSSLTQEADHDLEMNSTCVVFAESEIVGLLAQNVSVSSIAAAVVVSIAQRTVNLLSRLQWTPQVVFTGGVACNHFLRKKLTGFLNTDIKVPENPFITGAIGAALLASEER